MSGCDCVRCQTEECDASELCGCCLNAEVERLTTAIQRVRELIDTADTFTPPLVLTTAELRRALDVPCPTCSGPIRETVGLVCQTCGTDYGASDE